MIFPSTVRQVAEPYLQGYLRDYPGLCRDVTETFKLDLFCRLTAERLNQLDLMGFLRSRDAMLQFIRRAAQAYAHKQLEKAGVLRGEVQPIEAEPTS